MSCDHPDPEGPMTVERFDALGKELKVKWPEWFRELVHKLQPIAWQVPEYERWSPLDIYDTADLIRDTTLGHREEQTEICGFVFDEEKPGTSWNKSWVVVGSTSLGDTVLDTSSSDMKLWVYQTDEGMFDLFVDIKEHFGSVDALIAKELESHRKSGA